MDIYLIILLVVLFFVSLGTTYGIGRIILHLKERNKETLLMRRIKELARADIEKSVIRIEESEKRTEERRIAPKTMDEITVITKATEKIIFTDRDLSPAEISLLRRLGIVDWYGEYYIITEHAFKIIRDLVEKMKRVLEYNLSELDWELFRNGIRALGVVLFHEEEGPMLIPISDPFLILHKLGMPPTDIYMLKTNRLVVGENTFILHRVEEKEHGRPIEHIIIAEVVGEENAKKYIEMRSNTFIKMAKRKMRGEKA